LAAKEFNYTWEEFCALEGEQQSDVVAAYRDQNQVEAVVAKAQADESARKARRRK